MLRLFRRVDGDRHPFHQSSMDLLKVQLMGNDMEILRPLLLDEVRLHRQDVVHLDLLDVLQNLDALRQDDCLTLEGAHLDESDDSQEDVESLHLLLM